VARSPRGSGIVVDPVRVRAARLAAGLSLGQVARDDFSRTFLLFVEQGKSRPSQRVLNLIAKRTRRPVSFFLAAPQDAGDLADSAPELATEMVSVAARLRQLRSEARRPVDQGALKLLEVTVRQGAEVVRAIQHKPSGRGVELRLAGTRRERKKAS
jgi:transcriptional regulator with XRE-family HTH domain